MITKIIHISDLHIRTFSLHDMYRHQFKLVLAEIRKLTEEWEIPAEQIRIVLTGDVFHSKISVSNEQILLAHWFFSKLLKYGKLVIIPGNHDFLENNTNRVDSITPIVEILNDERICYYRDSDVYPDENINWVVYSLYQHNRRPDFTKDEKEKKYFGLFHGPIDGLSTDLGFKFEDGYSRLNFKDLDVVFCGDIHKRQVFKLPDGGKGVMVGSLIQQNFGETIKHHGFGVYDVETDEYDFVDIENPQPFLEFKINDITDIEHERETLVNLG